MRNRSRLIFPLALVGVVAAAGISMAADGGGGSGSAGASADTPTSFAADGAKRERGLRFHREFGDADVRAVLDDIRAAVAKQAPEIAGPVIDKAEQDGKITSAQADKLRQAAQDIAVGKRPDPRSLGRDEDVHAVVHDALAAAARKAPEIGEPIIAKAVQDDKITEAQADRIRALLKHAPRGPRFEGRHGPGFGGPPVIRDADVRAVLEDVHAAVAKQAPDVAGAVVDEAEKDGKISSAQADALRKAADDFVGRKPRGGPLQGLDLGDTDVREVLHDMFAAVAAKTPAIANPIVDKAVDDGKITTSQGKRIKRFLSRARHLRGPGHGPPGMGGSGPMGGPPPGMERRGPGMGPGGFAPGGPPPGGQSGAPATPSVPGTTS